MDRVDLIRDVTTISHVKGRTITLVIRQHALSVSVLRLQPPLDGRSEEQLRRFDAFAEVIRV